MSHLCNTCSSQAFIRMNEKLTEAKCVTGGIRVRQKKSRSNKLSALDVQASMQKRYEEERYDDRYRMWY